MKSQKLRIFVTTSHISTIYMLMYAKKTQKDDVADVLFTDTGFRRQELLDQIGDIARLHNWAKFHNFSNPVGGSHDFKPSLRKQITRKVKEWPVLKPIYSLLLKRHLHKTDQKNMQLVSDVLGQYKNAAEVEIYMMTQTQLNRALIRMYPDAQRFYMEHGIGDYYYYTDHQLPKGKFIAVFAEEFKRFLEHRHAENDWISLLPGIEDFPKLAEQIKLSHHHAGHFPAPKVQDKPVVFILLEAVDMYHVRDEFWHQYPEHILAQLDDPKKYHYILKPHPLHSKHSIVKTKEVFRKSGLSFELLTGEKITSISAEIIFHDYYPQTKHVFCLFSSACFYLSKLYSSKDITFWYSTEFMSKYTENAPPMYRNLFIDLRPLIDNVFAVNCKNY
ncbi:MAG: hypothetical protein Fur0041_03360 [Bacteroidia bacterium]